MISTLWYIARIVKYGSNVKHFGPSTENQNIVPGIGTNFALLSTLTLECFIPFNYLYTQPELVLDIFLPEIGFKIQKTFRSLDISFSQVHKLSPGFSKI